MAAPEAAVPAPIHRSFFTRVTREYLNDLLSPDAISAAGVFDVSAVNQLLEKVRRGRHLSKRTTWRLRGSFPRSWCTAISFQSFPACPLGGRTTSSCASMSCRLDGRLTLFLNPDTFCVNRCPLCPDRAALPCGSTRCSPTTKRGYDPRARALVHRIAIVSDGPSINRTAGREILRDVRLSVSTNPSVNDQAQARTSPPSRRDNNVFRTRALIRSRVPHLD